MLLDAGGCRPTVSTSVIGVDLGGTKVAVAALRGGQLGESLLQTTDCSSSRGADRPARGDGRAALRDDELAAVGVGVPSVVEFETGRVVSSANVPLADVPLRQVLGERLGVPVFVDNDATRRGARGGARRAAAAGRPQSGDAHGRHRESAAGSCSAGGSTAARPAAPASSGTRSSGSTSRARFRRRCASRSRARSSAVASGHALDRLAAQAADAASGVGARRPPGRTASRCSARTPCRRPTTATRRRGGCSRSGASGSGSGWRTRSTRSIPRRS